MTRYWAGGGPSDYTIVAGDTVTIGALTGKTAVVVGGIEITWWNAEAGGTQYTDLLNNVGAGVSSVLSSDTSDGRALGQIPRVQYPDNVTGAWASAAGGPRVWMPADVGDQAVSTSVDLNAHKAQANGHGTGLADLIDVTVPEQGSRTPGDVLGVLADRTMGLLTLAQLAGALLLDPRNSGGAYVGQTVPPPDPSQGQSGPSWFRMQATYAPDDDLPDMFQLGSTTAGGAWVLTGRYNGNGEGRDSPSDPDRVARRVFEMLQSLGGPSRKTFFELSTNPSNPALREKLFAAYGTGHATKPGWVEATRVMSALLGVQAGGSYNGLSAVNFRGRRASAGAPTSGTWATGDVVIDSAGALWLCTAAGTPGTWVGSGAAAPTAYTDLTLGTNMSHGTKHAASRLDRGGDSGRLRGTLTAGAAISSGAVVATIAATAHRPLSTVTTIARYSGGGAQIQIATTGEITLGAALSTGQSVWLDSLTWDMLA